MHAFVFFISMLSVSVSAWVVCRAAIAIAIVILYSHSASCVLCVNWYSYKNVKICQCIHMLANIRILFHYLKPFICIHIVFFFWLPSLVMVKSDFCVLFLVFHSLLFLLNIFIHFAQALSLNLPFQYALPILDIYFYFIFLSMLRHLFVYIVLFLPIVRLSSFVWLNLFHYYIKQMTEKTKWRRNIKDENHTYVDIEIEKWCIATI